MPRPVELISGYGWRDPAPWSKQVLGRPPRVPKLAPGGRRAQWESELGQEVAHGGLPYARAALRARPAGHSAGVTDPSCLGGDVGGGSPFPGSIAHWPRPKRAWGEGLIRLGMPRGALLLSTTSNLTSDRDSPERHGLTPTVQAMDTRALAGKPHSQGLSGDRARPRNPRLSGSLSGRTSPRGPHWRWQEGTGRRPRGWLAGPGLRRGPRSPRPGPLGLGAVSRSCRDVGVPFTPGKAGLSMSLLPDVGARLSGLGVSGR